MFRAIATHIVMLALVVSARAARIKHQPDPEKISFRVLAIAEPLPVSSFSINRDSLLVVITNRQGQSRVGKIAYIYMYYEYPFAPDLIDYDLLHTFTAVRDRSCDETWQSFSTKSQTDSGGRSAISNILRYTSVEAVPDIDTNQVLPCYVIREGGYKGSRRLPLNDSATHVAAMK